MHGNKNKQDIEKETPVTFNMFLFGRTLFVDSFTDMHTT